jgi:peptide/nickel transport system ATP-binding protein
MSAPDLLRASSIVAGYGGGRRGPHVLHDVDLSIAAGTTVGIVGESGSGKSTLARVIAGQLKPASGQVLLEGEDITALRGRARSAARRRIQLVPQNPYGSLDPRMTVGDTLDEAMGGARREARARRERIAELLQTVALDADAANRYPHRFSGGQRQRIAIARALAADPTVIVADEITSALDASVQAGVLNLLRDVQARTGISLVFITHDLSVASFMCDEIVALYLGRIVERGGKRLLTEPDHPYTRLLVDSLPGTDAFWETMHAPLDLDDAPDPAHPPEGCPFHPRCPVGPTRRPERQVCVHEPPALRARWIDRPASAERVTACHFPTADPPRQPCPADQ